MAGVSESPETGQEKWVKMDTWGGKKKNQTPSCLPQRFLHNEPASAIFDLDFGDKGCDFESLLRGVMGLELEMAVASSCSWDRPCCFGVSFI